MPSRARLRSGHGRALRFLTKRHGDTSKLAKAMSAHRDGAASCTRRLQLLIRDVVGHGQSVPASQRPGMSPPASDGTRQYPAHNCAHGQSHGAAPAVGHHPGPEGGAGQLQEPKEVPQPTVAVGMPTERTTPKTRSAKAAKAIFMRRSLPRFMPRAGGRRASALGKLGHYQGVPRSERSRALHPDWTRIAHPVGFNSPRLPPAPASAPLATPREGSSRRPRIPRSTGRSLPQGLR